MRKINIDAWDGVPVDDSDSISDLATKNHELSVWKIDDDYNNVEDIALALAMTRNDTNGIMTVFLSPEDIDRQIGLTIRIEEQEGKSAFMSRNSEHKNFMLYKIDDMVRLASYIHGVIDRKDATKCRFFDEDTLTKTLKAKIDSGELTKEDVSKKHLWKKKYTDYEKEKKEQAGK